MLHAYIRPVLARARALFLLLGCAVPMAAAAVVPAAPEVAARAQILVDFHSGKVLAEKNADERLEPASLTKMVTAYVVFAEMAAGHLALGDMVRVSERAWRRPGSRMFIEVGSEVSVENLLKGLIVQSGNDAATALAEHVAGDERAFADLMNQYATRLGMSGSHFMNASGLPHEAHYTTARDMATIAAALIRDFPDHYGWHATREFTYNGITQRNRNRLLWLDDSVDGLKTGHTRSAGYCLVASAVRGDMRLVAVVLGSRSTRTRTREVKSLLQYGFRFYETRRLFQAGETVEQVRVWQGSIERVGVGLATPLFVTIPRGQDGQLQVEDEVEGRVFAPVREGERRGTLRVSLGEEVVAERPLVALETVPEGGIWRQLSDRVRLWFE